MFIYFILAQRVQQASLSPIGKEKVLHGFSSSEIKADFIKGWRGGFILSAAEQFLKLELTKNFKVCPLLETSVLYLKYYT